MANGTERAEGAFVKEALKGTRLAHVQWVAETGSTNDDLLIKARNGAPEQVLITDLQTAGKGRRNRVWDAPAGSSILMSLLLRGLAPADGFWTVGAVALGAAQVIDEVTNAPCRLKWPNDVMVGSRGEEKKLAGVLAQLADDAVIVGIGINVNWPDDVPANMAERGSAINRHLDASADNPVDRAPLAAAILRRVIGHLESDRSDLRKVWKQHCSTLGREVSIERDSGVIRGQAVDVAEDGALMLEQDGVTSVHHVGDVVHARPITELS